MPTVNPKFLREELESAQQQVETLRKSGKVSPAADAVFQVLMPLLTLLLAVLLEKTTRKNSRNSSIPPSQMAPDDTAQRDQPGRRGQPADQPQSAPSHHHGNARRRGL